MTLNHALWHEFYTQRKKKKKSLNSQLASDPWRFPALLLVETFMDYSITFAEFFPQASL